MKYLNHHFEYKIIFGAVTLSREIMHPLFVQIASPVTVLIRFYVRETIKELIIQLCFLARNEYETSTNIRILVYSIAVYFYESKYNNIWYLYSFLALFVL